jgi:hypothetical protein
MTPQQHPLLRKTALYAAALAACAGVFALYTQPDVLVTLAQQVWACF